MAWFLLLRLLLLPAVMVLGSIVPFPTTNGWEEIDRRLFVTKNLLDTDNAYLAFYNSGGKLMYSNVTSPKNMPLKRSSSWFDFGAPAVAEIYFQWPTVVSNPVGLHTSEKQIQLFVQASDGQVYTMLTGRKAFNFGNWAKISATKLAFQEGVSLNGLDSVSVGLYKKQIVVFARTISDESTLFWCKGTNEKFSSWERIGDATPYLFSDATAILNPSTGYYEAFAIMNDGYVYQTWQRDDKVWASWRKLGVGQSKQAKMTSRPVAIVMSGNIFNGRLQVFSLGADGVVKQIWQTTCVQIDFLWGRCTWSWWIDLADKMPPTEGANVIAAGTNIHQGGELFAVDTSGVLWYSWQPERGQGWKSWEEVPRFFPTQPSLTKPYVIRDENLWWKVFGLGSDGIVTVEEQDRSMTVDPIVASGTSLTVSWSVPVDEATKMDWIGIYPAGANNDQYVDFVYVQGEQNPKSQAVPKGTVQIASLLPDGRYDVRYLVNRQFVSVMSKSVEYYSGSPEAHWVQVFRGILRGLGTKHTNFEECVEDGHQTIDAFRQSFKAFEDGQVFEGLELLGVALTDVVETLTACLQTEIAIPLNKFIIEELGTRNNLLIKALDILHIVYKDSYEIYGDIRAASNAFSLIQGYEQGGLCIGRVVKACLDLP